MAKVIVNEQRFFDGLLEKMNAQFQEAAEPIVRQAVADAERAIRAQLGKTVVGLLEHNFPWLVTDRNFGSLYGTMRPLTLEISGPRSGSAGATS